MRRPFFVATILLVFALFKNFWFLPTSMFEADQEYLALSGRSILQGNFTLIGAPTSVGGMFIGPLYSYVTAVDLQIFRWNPLVVNGLSALLGGLLIPALYLVGTKLLGEVTGTLAAVSGLFSVNFINQAAVPPLLFPLPLLTLLFLFVASTRWTKKRKALVLGTLTGVALNLHFSGIFFIPLLFLFGWWWVLPLFAFLSPLVFFDIRHHGLILKNLLMFLTSSSHGASPLLFRMQVFLAGVGDLFISPKIGVFGAGLLVVLLFLFGKNVWMKLLIGIPLLFFLFYGELLLPYYAIIAWAPVMLFVGELFGKIWSKGALGKIFIFSVLIIFVTGNFREWRRWNSGRSIDKKLAALRFIQSQSANAPIYLSRTIEPAANFGFDYLVSYVGITHTGNLSDPNYTLVIPAHFEGIQPDVQFGDIGVMLPKEKKR